MRNQSSKSKRHCHWERRHRGRPAQRDRTCRQGCRRSQCARGGGVWLGLILAASLLQAVTAFSAPADPGPGAEFFDQLDLTRPELAAVQTAVSQSDWPAARHALAQHLRTRVSPRWELNPDALTGKRSYDQTGADQVLAHRVNSIDIEWQFGPTIDWAFNPTTQPGSKWPHNHEWTWQLNRHHEWVALARAFSASGDERYAREFAAELKGWVQACPVPLDRVANVPFSSWRTIEAGIRAGTTWPEAFARFLPAKEFDDQALVLMLQGFADHAHYLMKFHTGGNWLTMEANGLYHVGALFPEFKDARLWHETAARRLLAELDIQVYPDGAQTELTPGYHEVALRNFLGPVSLAPLTGLEPPPGYLAKMDKMFAYLLYSMQPDGRTPPLNDSGANDTTPYLQDAARLFPQRQDFQWAASRGQQGLPPKVVSLEFPYAGQFIMRSGWQPDALWLCMDGGPFGSGHQHEDKLSVILTAYGRPLLVEGGTYTYDASEWRSYVLSSRAHNLVLVDGFQQNRRHQPVEPYVVKTPLPHVWESTDTFDHAAARYDEGWGPKSERLVRHTRHVFFLKPDLFIVADQLEPADTRAHTYEALFHLDAPAAKVDGLRVETQNPGPNLALLAFGPDSVRIVQGQKKPVVQGWLPDSAGGYGGIRPIPTAIYSKSARGPITLLYALCPAPKAATCPVKAVQLAGDQLTVQLTDGQRRSIRFKPF